MTKNQANYYLRRCYTWFDQADAVVIFKKMTCLAGYTEDNTIYLNPLGDVIPTAVHEILHILYPDKPMDADNFECSQWVRDVTFCISKHISNAQSANLFLKISSVLKKC